jgi:antitoxin component YwqK of YwqJK toxin-antitoxin module
VNTQKEGVWKRYDVFGTLMHQTPYRNGLKDGEEIAYEGEIQIRCSYQMGEPLRICRQYDRSGAFKEDLPGFQFEK